MRSHPHSSSDGGEDFHVDIQKDGSYRVQVKGHDWLYSAPTFFRLVSGADPALAKGGFIVVKLCKNKG